MEELRTVALVICRASIYTGQALLTGLPLMLLFVLRPAFAGLSERKWFKGRAAVARKLELVVKSALASTLVATAALLMLQASVVADLTGGSTWDSLPLVLDTRFGLWHMVRLGILTGLAILLFGAVHRRALESFEAETRSRVEVWWASWIIMAFALLPTTSLTGHAAAAEPASISVGNDVVHLGASAIWLSGILVLRFILASAWEGKGESAQVSLLAPVVTRFSRVALVSVTVVTATGAINSLFDVGAVNDLRTTDYGQALLVKLWIFLFVLGLGAYNHFILRRRLEKAARERASSDAAETLRTTIALETLGATIILIATAVLTGLPKTS